MKTNIIVEEQRSMVEDCEDRESRLSEWESGFIDSIRDRLDEGLTLTPKQADKLEAIWEKITEMG